MTDASQQKQPDYVGDLAIVGRGLHSSFYTEGGRMSAEDEQFVAQVIATTDLSGRVAELEQALEDACDVAIWLSALIGGVVDGDSPEVHKTWQESMRPKLFAALDARASNQDTKGEA